MPETAWKLVEHFWPGQLTLVLPRAADVPDAVTGGQDTVALRVATGAMHLHGWYFDMAQGSLLHYNPARNGFEPNTENSADPSGVTA